MVSRPGDSCWHERWLRESDIRPLAGVTSSSVVFTLNVAGTSRPSSYSSGRRLSGTACLRGRRCRRSRDCRLRIIGESPLEKAECRRPRNDRCRYYPMAQATRFVTELIRDSRRRLGEMRIGRLTFCGHRHPRSASPSPLPPAGRAATAGAATEELLGFSTVASPCGWPTHFTEVPANTPPATISAVPASNRHTLTSRHSPSRTRPIPTATSVFML